MYFVLYCAHLFVPLQLVMRKGMIVAIGLLMLLVVSCTQKKRDVVYYEQMLDSIRKAETVAEVYKQAGMYDNVTEAFLDTLRMGTLPIEPCGDQWQRIGSFTDVPLEVGHLLGYDGEMKLKAMALPWKKSHQVILVVDLADEMEPSLYLYTLDKHHAVEDMLCLYEQTDENRDHDFGKVYTDYFVTNQYEITLIKYYQSHDEHQKPELIEQRRYEISHEGKIEEVIINYD